MGIMQAGILGVTTGKVGGVVGSTWKDKNTLRSYRATIATSQTAAAVTTRNNFAKAMEQAKIIAPVIALDLWQRFEKSKSGYNAVVGMLRKCWRADGNFEYPNMQVANGKMAAPILGSCETNMGVVTVRWDTKTSGYELPTDIPYVILYKQDGSKIMAVNGADYQTQRSGGQFQFNGSAIDVVANSYFVAVAFKRVDGSVVSKTDVQLVVQG